MAEEQACRLYLITPESFDLDDLCAAFEAACDGGDVAALQLRMKGAPRDVITLAAKRLMPLCHARDIAFILNDDPELALEIGADGVHLGADDMPAKKARALIGDQLQLGISCYDSMHSAMTAGEHGADYVAFGAFFPSTTKQSRGKPTLELLQRWTEQATVPAVAIGGLTPENCRPVIEHGADFLAICSGIWQHPEGPKAASHAFQQVIDSVYNV